MTSDLIDLPLFPLPDLVFFPHTVIPLHVFEPRYKQMVEDSLEDRQLIGMVQLKPGWEDDYYGVPPIYKILTIGEIINYERHEDGRFDLSLGGLYRAQIVSESNDGEYRKATVEILPDLEELPDAEEVQEVHELLVVIAKKILFTMPPEVRIMYPTDPENLTPGALIDVLSAILVESPYDRQSLLSETDVVRRQKLLRVQLRHLFALPGDVAEPEPESSDEFLDEYPD